MNRIEKRLKDEGYPPMMTADEVAEAMRCHRSTVFRYAAEGRLPRYRRSERATFFDRQDVAKMMGG